MTQEPATVAPDPMTTEAPCDRTGPITINTYGCGTTTTTGRQTDLLGLESQVQRLTGRVTQLEVTVNQLIAGGGGTGGTGGGTGGTGGPTFVGQRFKGNVDILLF